MSFFSVHTAGGGIRVDLSGDGTNNTFADTGAFSFSFWFRHKDGTISSDDEVFFIVEQDSSNRVRAYGRADPDNTVAMQLEIDTTLASIDLPASNVTDTNWHHVALTWDTGSNTWTLYVDGTSTDSATNAGVGSWTAGTVFDLMADATTADANINLRDWCVYRAILTQDEVTGLANGCPPMSINPGALESIMSGLEEAGGTHDPISRKEGSITGTWQTTPDAEAGYTDLAPPLSAPMYRPMSPVIVASPAAQNITAPLSSVTGLLANTFTLTFTLNGILEQATLFAPAAINEGQTINAILQTATGMYIPSVPWDQTVAAPVITASGNVVAAVQWDQQLAGALLQATGTLDTGVWVINQTIAGQILSATGILDTQTWLVDSSIAGVFIDPTGLIAATFTGEQLYTGDFTFETPASDSFTIETPGSDSFTEE